MTRDPRWNPASTKIADRFGVDHRDIRRVIVENDRLIHAGMACLVDGAMRNDHPEKLKSAVFAELTLWMIEQTWGRGQMDAVSAAEALADIRSALRDRFQPMRRRI